MSNHSPDKSSFEGTSQNGDINEAIFAAVQLAKTELKTDYVEWALSTVKGKNGGFILINEISVVIDATYSKPTINIV